MKKTAWVCAFLVVFPIVVLTLLASLSAGAVPASAPFSPWVDQRGQIRRPTGFRSGWAHLGTWSVAGADGDVTLHDVYTEPDSAAHFRERGAFPDGATLVKEVRRTRPESLTTGQARWAADPVVWFVMVKDAVGRFAGNPSWGEGWGWALFEAQDPTTPVPGPYTEQCRPCHVPAQDTDWVYVRGYPGLRGAGALDAAPPPRAPAVPPPDLPAEGPVVTIRDMAFVPAEIRVARGQTITWVNQDDVLHTATGVGEVFDTGLVLPGRSVRVAFGEAGSFPYFCTPHPYMTARVIVVDTEE